MSSAFEKWRQRLSDMTGLGGDQTKLHCQGCEQWKSHLLQYSPSVLFLMKHLKLSGCAVPPENIICAPCDPSAPAASSTPRSGGFSPTSGAILLCAGSFFSRSHMEQTLTHELVHLYDHCLFKVDWGNLRHHACSEIRANSLSGDCKWTREVRRGVVRFSKQHQDPREANAYEDSPMCCDVNATPTCYFDAFDDSSTISKSEISTPRSTLMAFRELSPGYADTVYTIDPRIIVNTATNTPAPADEYAPTIEEEQQKSAWDDDGRYPDFFTVTPSMDAILDSFSAQSALWLETPPTIPSTAQFDTLLNDVLPNPYTLRGPCYTPSMGAEASTSQLPRQSPPPLALSQGTSEATWPLTASPEPSSSWQEPPYHCQESPQPVDTQLTTSETTSFARRVGTPRIRHDSSLRRDSLLSPPPFVRRSARPKARVNYNYDPLPADAICEEDEEKPHQVYHRHATIVGHTPKISRSKKKKLRDTPYTPPDGLREVFVCGEGDCAHPGRKPMTFTRKADLMRHSRSVHDEIKRFRCEACERPFPRHDALTRHVRSCRKLREQLEGSEPVAE
ncbi:Mitochondrial inner membrane protease atp23 [Pleurotus pulmonarius]|nr:Mitochondrial inner membrane protease atp23 [Pleurotus pulmonarius]